MTKRKVNKADLLGIEMRRLMREEGITNVLDSAFDRQLELIEHPSRFKAALCSARSGKSTMAGIYMLHTALTNPGCNCIYIVLDHGQAKAVMFKDILEPLIEKYSIAVHRNMSDLTYTLTETGSVLRFYGFDANDNVSNKIFGVKYKLAVIDECAYFRTNLSHIIYKKILPRLQDEQGTCMMIGTPDTVNEASLFYQVTREDPQNRPPEDAGLLSLWEVRRWTAFDNPHQVKQAELDLDMYTKANPGILDDPAFQQETFGKWTNAGSSLVYSYANASRTKQGDGYVQVNYGTNGGDAIKELPPDDYIFEATTDWGWDDSAAIVVGAYSRYSPILYIVDCFKQSELTTSEFAEIILEWKSKYKLRRIWADHNKQSLMDINQRYKLNLLPTNQKQDKVGQIKIMNSSFYLGEVRIHEHEVTRDNVPSGKKANPYSSQYEEARAYTGTAPLIKELRDLPWDQRAWFRAKQRVEHAGYDNHLCFVAGTKVETASGPKSIETIQIGEEVLTRRGYRKVTAAGSTGVHPVYRLTTKNGRSLIGTGNHPIYVNGSMRPLNVVKAGDILTCIEEHQSCQTNTDQAYQLDTEEHHTAAIQNQSLESCASTGPARMANDCIAFSGKSNMERFRTATTSTIKMTIRSITSWITSRLSAPRTTSDITTKSGRTTLNTLPSAPQLSLLPESQPKNGTPHQKAEPGTQCTEKKSGAISRFIRWSVKSATSLLNPSALTPSFAETTATPGSAKRQASTMRPERAPGAAKSIESTGTVSSVTVHDRVADVTPLAIEQEVFNLTIDDEHEYFANGILTHNCDCLLYLFKETKFYRTKERPPQALPPGSPEAFNAAFKQLIRNKIRERDKPWYLK